MGLGSWFQEHVVDPVKNTVEAITEFTLDITGVNWVIDKLTPDIPDIPRVITENRVQQILNPDYNRPVVYGETEVAGNLIFYNTTGTDNVYLDMVIDICEGEIEGIEKVYMNDEPIALFDAGTGLEFTPATKYFATNPLYGSLKATGFFAIPTIPLVTPSTIYSKKKFIVNGVTIIPGTDFTYGATFAEFITNFVNYLNASVNPSLSVATYSAGSLGIHIEYDTVGAVGNSFYFQSRNRQATVIDFSIVTVYLSGGRDEYYSEAFFYNGTDAQTVNTQLQSAYAGWDANHALPGVSYAYIRLIYNQDLFRGGIPQFKFKLRGRKVYDPRTTTTIYSANPAICLRDYLLNSRFGKGLTSSDLNNQSVIDSANACDVTRSGLEVDGITVVNYNSYEIGAIVDTANLLKTNVEYFLQSMNGSLPYVDGVYHMRVLGAGNGTVTLTEEDIIGNLSVAAPSKKEKFNKAIISFPDKMRHYKIGEAPYINATYLSDDGQELSKNITAPYVDYYPRAIDIAELAVNMSRVKSGVSFTTTSKILENIPGDIVNLTYDTLGWSAKEFRLSDISIRPDGLCDIVLIEHFDSFYSLTQKQEQPIPNDTTLKSPYDVTKPTITEILSDKTTHLVSVEGTVTPRIFISWDDNDEYTDYHLIYAKKSTDSLFREVGKVNRTDTTSFYVSGLEWGIQYDIGIVTVNGIGSKSQMAIASLTTPNPLTEAIYDYPDVTGLELIGRGTNEGQGNNTQFEGKDIRIQWRLSSNNVTMEFGSIDSEVIGGTGGVIPFTLKGYKVKVFHPNDIEPRQIYTVVDPHFTYSLDKNIEDGLGSPSRTITFEVTAFGQVSGYGIDGESETPARITVTNPQPALPTAINFEPNFQSFRFSFTRPTDADYKGIKLWVGTGTGFARNNATLEYDGPDNNIVVQGLLSGTTYYARFLAYDDFGEDGATESAEYAITLPQAISGDEVTSLTMSKITAGDLVEQVNVAGVFVATGTEAVINKTFTDSTWRLEMGPVSYGDTTYILRYHNGSSTYFSVDSVGNAMFGGDISLDTNNYWKQSNNTFQVGDGTNNMTWNGTDLTVATLKTSSGSGQRIELNPSSDNQLHFYGNNGSVVEQLAVIGINTVDANSVIGWFGSNTSTNVKVGIYAQSYSNVGVYGTSNSNAGIYGISTSSYGVRGSSTTNYAIYGSSGSSDAAIYGTTSVGTASGIKGVGTNYGVYGQATSISGGAYGVYGLAGVNGTAIYGTAGTGGIGVYGISVGIGVQAESSGTLSGPFYIVPKSNTTDPTGGAMGQFYVRSDGVLRFHDGTSWKTVTVV